MSQRRLLLWLVVGAVVVAGAVVGAVFLLSGRAATREAGGTSPPKYADVVITDLVSQETYQGTLGSVATDPITTGLAGTITQISSPGDLVTQGQTLFKVDGRPVVILYGEEPAFRDIAVGQERVTVAGRLSGTVTWVAPRGTVLQQGDVLYRVDDRPVVVLNGSLPAYRDLRSTGPALIGTDVLQLERALVTLGYDPDSTVTVDGKYTDNTSRMVERWQEDLGFPLIERDGVVHLGQVVFLPGPAQVLHVLVKPGDPAGGAVAELAAGSPASGADVRQLEEALVALGYDAGGRLAADGVFSAETTQALLAFQQATGQEQDGIMDMGEVVFRKAEVRVTEQRTSEGGRVDAGSPVLGISLPEQVVRMALPAGKQSSLAAGDRVKVELPDRSRVDATVASIAKTATLSADPRDDATFEVLIRLEDPAAARNLDEAPVHVIVVSGGVQHVTAVPVSALVALLGGGYAVEVDVGGGTTQLVAVQPGFFGSNNLVQVTSSGLKTGDRVVVP